MSALLCIYLPLFFFFPLLELEIASTNDNTRRGLAQRLNAAVHAVRFSMHGTALHTVQNPEGCKGLVFGWVAAVCHWHDNNKIQPWKK